MSKHINVNPGQYKVAGRERPGEDGPEPDRSPAVKNDEAAQQRCERKQNKERQNKKR